MSERRDDEKLAPGAMIGGYRLERRLGQGGAGAVYAAEEPTIKKRVAIKVLRRALADDESMAARFEREARAVNEIHHPGIVDVFAIGRLDDGRPYLVMSLLEGASLRAEIEAHGRLAPAEAWRVAREVADAVAAAHHAGIVHRDLKPDNVFLERVEPRRGLPPRVRVLDFGIAKIETTPAGVDPMKLTGTGVPLGTPAYMAPEQWWAAGITARTDQYALGVMLFEMLSGRTPFASQPFAELVQSHVHERPPALAAVGVEVPEAVEALVARLLAKAPDDRFASMAAVIEAGDRAFAMGGPESPPKPPEITPPSLVTMGGAESPPKPPEMSTGALITSPPPEVAARTAPGRAPGASALGRYLALHAAIVLLGSAGVVAVGYSGYARYNVVDWFRIGGWGQFVVVGSFPVAVLAFVVLARRRAATGVASNAPFWFALFPALQGAFTTYTGWTIILRSIPRASAVDRLAIFGEGTYEANAARFLGFAVASILFLSLAALPGVSGMASATTTLHGALGVRRREALAAALGLAALAVIASLVGAPSAALIAGAGAVAAATSAALPTVHGETAARDELERATAGILAVALAVAVGITRIEAREAILWGESPTRAARVAEILAAQAERDVTIPVAVASLAVVAAVEVLRLRRLQALRALTTPRTGTALLATALALGIAGDFVLHGRFTEKRAALRAEIGAQFALFARLDPPPGDALAEADRGRDPPRFAPHRATALQVTRDVVAVDGRGVARLGALGSPEGVAHLASELDRALAQAALEEHGATDLDLSVSIDRETGGDTLLRLLQIARGAGVKRVEVLLTRGASPGPLLHGPPEIDVVLPSDFVAIPAELADAGLALAPDLRFGQLAPALVERALAGESPVALAVGVGRR
jgi:serine/threonine protein kinase